MTDSSTRLTLSPASPPALRAQAAGLLECCEGVVVVHGLVSLRPTPAAIVCEVIDPAPGSHRCAEEYTVLMENAVRCLASPALEGILPDRPLRWILPGE